MPTARSGSDAVVFGPLGEPCDVLGTVFGDNKDIILAMFDLFRRFHHPRCYRIGRNVDKLGLAQYPRRRIARGQGHMIAFDPDPPGATNLACHGMPVIVALPVGIDDVALDRPPPRLSCIDFAWCAIR